MGFEVETLKFEGPLDLMLHLIHEQQLDIFDLDMEVLTDQYLAYIHAMEDLQLEVESEYLVELATLIEYKSKKLLPKRDDEIDDDYEAIEAASEANLFNDEEDADYATAEEASEYDIKHFTENNLVVEI
jgi:chromatin segregation and condensation protein Rec8/ScpA/Scc1 (kleisin family)